MASRSITLKALREREEAQVPPRLGVRIVAVFVVLQILLLAALMLLFPARAGAAPVKGEVAVKTAGGYARLVFTLAEETEAEVRLANGILIIGFKQPVDVPVDRIPMQASSYVNAARRDPDGAAVRLALNRKVTVNTMAAGEKLFVDLLPEGWTGLPPGLPQEVDRGPRAARARGREEGAGAAARGAPAHAAAGARAGRHAADLHALHVRPAGADRGLGRAQRRDKMTLTFEAPLRFDLADVQATLPPMIAVDRGAVAAQETSLVSFEFIGKVDVRTFREDNNYILDVQPIAAARRGEARSCPSSRPPPRWPRSARSRCRRRRPRNRRAGCARNPPRQRRSLPPPSRPRHKPRRDGAKPARSRRARAGQAGGAASASRPAVPLRRADRAGQRRRPPSRRASAGDAGAPADPAAPVVVEVRRQGDAVRLTFPFAQPTPGRDVPPRRYDLAGVRQPGADRHRQDRGAVRPRHPQRDRHALAARARWFSSSSTGRSSTSAGADGVDLDRGRRRHDARADAAAQRDARDAGRRARQRRRSRSRSRAQLHRLADAEVGDTLLVVTALGPARGFLAPQDFVEFNTLVSTHGVVLQPLADDVAAEVDPDKIVIGRPAGLTLSSAARAPARRRAARRRAAVPPVHARSAGLGFRPRVRISATARPT